MDIINNKNKNNIDHLEKTSMETISKYLPNNSIYITRPKNNGSVSKEIHLANTISKDALKESLYVAYPKTKISDTANETAVEVFVKEDKKGPFISYPKNKATIEEKATVEKKTNRSLNGGYVAQPKNTRSTFRKERVLRAPIAMFRNNVIVMNLLQVLRLKVS